MEVEYELFCECKSDTLDKFLDVYKKDPKKARVLFLNSGKGSYYSSRLVLFKRGDDFEISTIKKNFGISTSNRVYSSDKKIKSIIYKSGKFWFVNNSNAERKFIVQLTYGCMRVFFQDWPAMKDNLAYKFLLSQFSWIRFISENDILYGKSFNTFTKHSLYNLNDALRHVFKLPLPVIRVCLDYLKDSQNLYDVGHETLPKFVDKLKRGLISIENLRLEMLMHPYFKDTLKLGSMLNKKINCSWSLKRLVAEHDKWSVEVTDVLAEFSELRELRIKRVYLDFADFAKLVPLKTNQALIREGSVQHHCVGSYSDKIDSGFCCIYHVNGYTLELKYAQQWVGERYSDKDLLYINQFRGFRNTSAPEELQAKIQMQLDEFNRVYEPNETDDMLVEKADELLQIAWF